MPENEEIINNGGGGGEAQEQVIVETPEVKQWTIVPDNEPTHIPIAEAFKVVPEVEEKEPEVIVEEKPIVEVKEEIAEISEQPTIDAQKVLDYLRTEKGFKGETLDELTPKEEKRLSATAEAFQKYVDETNNESFEDFVALQKDWTKEDPSVVLKMKMKMDRPHLSNEDIDLLYEDKYVLDELDEYASESETKQNRLKEIKLKDDYQDALTQMESQKEKYKVVRGSDALLPEDVKVKVEAFDNWNRQQEENKVAFEQNRQDFQSKTDNVFNPNFEGFKVNVGESEFKVKPENLESAKNTLSDLSNFDKKFFDETGKLKDPEGYYKALHFAMNPDKMAEHFINIGKALQVEDDERESKNIQVQGQSSRTTPLIDSGKRWHVEKD